MKKQAAVFLVAVLVAQFGGSGAMAVASQESQEARQNAMPSLAPMLENVTPAVVSITTTRSVQIPDQIPFFDSPEFRRFFGPGNIPEAPEGQEAPQRRGAGSGVIVDAGEGYVITNHHVIDGADEVIVTLVDERQFEATVIGSDPSTDIALLQIDAENVMDLQFANIDDLRVGDYVAAIGNPFGIGQTVTSGIVSALGRAGLNRANYEDFIQTDAAINVGNSGGALVDLEGRLVGINTAIISRSGGNAGVGFAVPVDMIEVVVQHLERDGEVRRGQLGVNIRDLTPEMEQALDTGVSYGALVVNVVPGSAADEAGIQSADVIVELNGQRINSSRELRNAVGLLLEGDPVELVVYRDGEEVSIDAVIGSADGVASARGDANVFRGAQLSTADQSLTNRTGETGVEVVDVAQQSPAWTAGLRPGDLIYQVNQSDISNLSEFNSAVAQSNDVTALRVIREGRRILVILS